MLQLRRAPQVAPSIAASGPFNFDKLRRHFRVTFPVKNAMQPWRLHARRSRGARSTGWPPVAVCAGKAAALAVFNAGRFGHKSLTPSRVSARGKESKRLDAMVASAATQVLPKQSIVVIESRTFSARGDRRSVKQSATFLSSLHVLQQPSASLESVMYR